MNIQQLIALADIAKTGAFSETQIAGMVRSLMGDVPHTGATFSAPLDAPQPLRLGYHEALGQAVAEAHPRFENPTWTLNGKAMTSVYGFLDAIRYRSASGTEKFIAALVGQGAITHTTAHFAQSDDGPICLPKRSQYETKVASVEDLTAQAYAQFRRDTLKRLEALGAVAPRASRPNLRAVA